MTTEKPGHTPEAKYLVRPHRLSRRVRKVVVPGTEAAPTHKMWSVANLILGFFNPIGLILAILAIINSNDTERYNQAGNFPAALVTSSKARGWNIASAVVTGIGVLILVACLAVFLGMFH